MTSYFPGVSRDIIFVTVKLGEVKNKETVIQLDLPRSSSLGSTNIVTKIFKICIAAT